eukprot:COSAG02_NODE_99_length_37069_cov_24.910957_28_plen_65_part_00
MIGANGSVRGKKEFEPSSLAAESEPLLALTRRTISPWRTIRPALEDDWLDGPFYLGRSVIHSLA